MKSRLFTLFILSSLLISCKKEGSTESGNSTLLYRSSSEYPLEIETGVLTDKITIENANPYGSIVGQIMATANESKVDGKSMKYSDLDVNPINFSAATVSILSQREFVKQHLVNSKIVFKYPNGTGSKETIVATFGGYYNNQINYKLSTENLKEDFKQSGLSGSFYVDFEFDQLVPDVIDLNYDFAFDYGYTMKFYTK